MPTSIAETIQTDLKTALRQHNAAAASALRMLLAAIKNKEIELRKRDGLSDAEILAVIAAEAKKRAESAAAFSAAGRMELAQKEEQERTTLMKFLPAQMSDDELRAAIEKVVAALGTAPNFGVAMKELARVVGGRADLSRASALLKEKLDHATL